MNKTMTKVLLSLFIGGFVFCSCNKPVNELKTQKDSISYAFGVMEGQNVSKALEKETKGENYNAFMAGLQAGLDQKNDSSLRFYMIGLQVAASITQAEKDSSVLPIDKELVVAALKQAIDQKDVLITAEDAESYLREQFQKAQSSQIIKQYGQNKKSAEAFMSQNGKKKGIITTSSGLQYEVIKAGNGKTHATEKDIVSCNYTLTLPDGTIIDSNTQHGNGPATFQVGNLIKGWKEALTIMPVGSKWKLYVPYQLGYGEQGIQSPDGQFVIPPFSPLIFDIELLEIKSK